MDTIKARAAGRGTLSGFPICGKLANGKMWVTLFSQQEKKRVKKTEPGLSGKKVTDEVTDEVAGEVVALLRALSIPLSRKALQEKMGLKGQANFRERYLEPVLDAELVEMTQPDSPKSPTQKYRLTEKGKSYLKKQ